jgi:hypothetical protein
MLHPPGAELLLARLRERQKRQSEQAQQQEQKDLALTVITGKPQHSQRGGGRGGGKGGR